MDSFETSGEIEWIVHKVKGQQFLKSRTVQIGDTVLTSKKSNICNTDINNSQPQLPRSWTRLLSSHVLLQNMNASEHQLRHHLHFQSRLLFDDEPRHFLHLLERGNFGRFHRNLSQNDIRLIRDYLQKEVHSRCNAQLHRFKSLADSSNRKRDKNRVESELFLAEFGSTECNIHFFNAANRQQLIAVNYNRIVYGDHGPYIEFERKQIEWSAFPDTPSKGDSVAYYNEFYSVGGDKSVKLYAQKKTVCDQPNPPKGKYSQNHNRSEGYADYKVGFFYISPDDLCVNCNDNRICPYLYLLTMHRRDNSKKQAMRNKNISKASSSKQFQPKFKFNEQNTRKEAKKREVSEEKQMRSVYDPKILSIEIVEAPKINTREGKRVINACLSGEYIPGLIYIDDFISEKEEMDIRQQIIDKNNEWGDHWIKTNRNWLQFGYFLNYETMDLYKNKEKGFECIPDVWQWIAQRIQKCLEQKLNQKCKEFNQLLLNSYTPSQGINDHTDRTHCFGPVIAGLSLFSCCVIQFKEKV